MRHAHLLLLGMLSACGYTVEYEGQVVDSNGVAQRSMAVTLRDVAFAEGRYTDPDVIARADVAETVTTDEDGRFTLSHPMGGGFGCGVEEMPAIVVAPDGPTGQVAVALGVEGAAHHFETGPIQLLGSTEAIADADGVSVVLPQDSTDGVLVYVDKLAWRPSEGGDLPAAALGTCDGACDHEISMVTRQKSLFRRATAAKLTAAAPVPKLTVQADSAGNISAATIDPVASPEIFIDGLFTEEQALAATPPDINGYAISVASGPLGSLLSYVPPSDCTVYGGGLRCTPKIAQLTGISVAATVGARLRVYGH